MAYGIANTSGQPDTATANAIVATALAAGYSWFDTAQAYGSAETVLGAAIQAADSVHPATVITKLAPNLNPQDPDAIYAAIHQSCISLGGPPLWGIMLHRASWLKDWDHGLGQGILRAKKEGLIQHIGVSVYDAQELRQVIQTNGFDIVQLPFNAWDPEFVTDTILADAQAAGICCFVRSIYLQGLVTMTSSAVSEYLSAAIGAAAAWESLCTHYTMTPVQLAMSYVRHFQLPMVVGVETVIQFQENIGLLQLPPLDYAAIRHIQSVMHPLAKKDFVSPPHWQVKSRS